MGFDKMDVETERYVRAAQPILDEQVRDATKAALEKMIPRVPVYTGTSRGALQSIGNVVGEAVPIEPIAVRKGEGPAAGESQSSTSIEATSPLRTRFAFSTDVKQFLIGEFYSDKSALKNPSPWGSIEAAREEFRAYLRSHLKQALPGIKSFVVRTRVRT